MISTERLKLRPWRESDRLPFRVLCADARAMEHLGGPRTAEQADAGMQRCIDSQQQHGHCFWVVERKADHAFIGYCGLKIADQASTPIDGMIEIGWCLRRDAWGHGYAKEAAYACFDWGFRNLDCADIVAATTSENSRSWGLMDRLRMRRRPDLDFDEAIPPGSSTTQRMIVYSRSRGWSAGIRD
jgi:RimJ/RimL family protein N-acetyltransferase